MATHSSVLAWRIPGMEEPGRLLSMGSQSRTRLKQQQQVGQRGILYDQVSNIQRLTHKHQMWRKARTITLLLVPPLSDTHPTASHPNQVSPSQHRAFSNMEILNADYGGLLFNIFTMRSICLNHKRENYLLAPWKLLF